MSRAHLAHVRRVARRHGLSDADADDAVQQTFITAVLRLGDIRQGRERSFLVGTVTHVVRHLQSRAAARREVLAVEPEVIHDSLGADEELDLKRLRVSLVGELRAWPEKLLDAFVLFELEGMTLLEISRLRGDPVGTVASRVRRGRALLRRVAAATEDAESAAVAACPP